jgi:FKBP-type peptidyl-prolyl cis-trans isomerase FkpA
MIKYVLWTLIAGMLITTSCLKKNSNYSTCSYDPCATKVPDSQSVKIESYLSSKNITAVKHCSGMYYTIVNQGTGDSPTACSSVLITDKGTLTDGTVFDSTSSPVTYSLLNLIQGWANGVPLLKRGGEIKLYIPPSLAYGQVANGPIPANSIVIFDINLLDFQ